MKGEIALPSTEKFIKKDKKVGAGLDKHFKETKIKVEIYF